MGGRHHAGLPARRESMDSGQARLRRTLAKVLAIAALPAAALTVAATSLPAQAAKPSDCQLNSARGAIKHVIQLQFDNVHFRRDNPNVPSDIEQMPNLYNFLVGNVATVYGANSPEAAEAADTSDNGTAKTTADFIGVAIHCAQGHALCASTNRGVADVLPDEPGGYPGFNGIFGHKYVAPQISA